VYIFEPELLNEIPPGRAVSIERETYPMLLQKGYKMAIFDRCSYWLDLGTPAKYLKAHKDILNGLVKIREHDFNENTQYISKKAKISRYAKIKEPVYIGDNAEISSFAYIGPNTVLFSDSKVDTDAKVVESIVWNNAHVGGGASVVNSVVMSNCRVDRNTDQQNTVVTEDTSYVMAI